jgi:arylsulfatase A-like enzyme
VIVLDGLRPDYVTAERMPNLHALGQRGVVFADHHSVFPTVTRVNAASISTGAYPVVHGLLGNQVFIPEINSEKFLDTSNRANLLAIDAASGGQLLTAPTLGESLQSAGQRLLVVSAGSTGSSFLLSHKLSGGAILHTDYALPQAFGRDLQEVLGPAPDIASPDAGRNRWTVDAYLRVGELKVEPLVAVLWLSDPDQSAHDYGVGAPITIEALGRVDAEIGRIQKGLADEGLLDRFNIWVTSDHGFSTYTNALDLTGVLYDLGGKMADGSPSIVMDAGAVYVRDGNQAAIRTIVERLQRHPAVGAIFTRAAPGAADGFDGSVPGTLSLSAVRWNHPRAADVLFSPDWSDEANEHGFQGTSSSYGVAGHGSASPFDVHATLIAAGPDLKRQVVSKVPTANVDLAPTLLRLVGLDVPASMQGRPLTEAFARGPDPSSVKVDRLQHSARSADGRYEITASFSVVETPSGPVRYFDYARVNR